MEEEALSFPSLFFLKRKNEITPKSRITEIVIYIYTI
jgi:hypothetical protein